MLKTIDLASRPDLYEMRDGEWFPRAGMVDQAEAWLLREQRKMDKARRKEKRLERTALERAATREQHRLDAVAAGSPTAIMRALQRGETRALPQYRHPSSISAIVARMEATLGVEFTVAHDPLLDCLTISRLK